RPLSILFTLFFYSAAHPPSLHSFPTRRSSDLVNLTHMQDGDARTAEFEALNIPVLQGLNERSATVAEWRKGISGVGGSSTAVMLDRKSTRLNSSHVKISYAVFCLKKKTKKKKR